MLHFKIRGKALLCLENVGGSCICFGLHVPQSQAWGEMVSVMFFFLKFLPFLPALTLLEIVKLQQNLRLQAQSLRFSSVNRYYFQSCYSPVY